MKIKSLIILVTVLFTLVSDVFSQTELGNDASSEITVSASGDSMAISTLSKLDLDSYYLTYVDLEGIIPPLRSELLSFASKIDAVLEEGSEEKTVIDLVVNQIDPLLEWLGIYSIKSYGVSIASKGSGVSKAKTFVQFDEQIESSALRKIVGAPSDLKSRYFMPQDTACAALSTFSINGLWTAIKEGVERFGDEQMKQQVQMNLSTAKQQMGIDIDALISTIADECFMGIKLDEEKAITVPLPNAEPLSMAEPSIILGFKVIDTSLYDTITTLLSGTGLPSKELVIGDEKAISIPLALPSPVKVEPTLMMHDGYLLITSTPDLMRAAVSSYTDRSGLSLSEAFQTYLGNAPEKTSSLRYISNRFYRAVIELTKAITMNQPMPDPENALAKVIQEETMRVLENRAGMEAAAWDLWNEDGLYVEMNVKSSTDNLVLDSIRQPLITLIAFGIQGMQVKRQQQEMMNAGICDQNLSEIDYAKQQWAEDNDYPADPPTPEDLELYLDGPFPVCPSGGVYEINGLDTPVSCSIHSLE